MIVKKIMSVKIPLSFTLKHKQWENGFGWATHP